MPPKNKPSKQSPTQVKQQTTSTIKNKKKQEIVEDEKPKMVQKTLKGQTIKSQDEPTKSRSKKFDTSTKNITTTTSSDNWLKGDGKLPKKLLIASWNVNGIRSVLKKGELQGYVTKKNPDILCINETKIDQKAFKSQPISLKGYQGYWNFCKSAAGYSGVAIFSKFKPLSITQDLPNHPKHSQQGRVLNLEFQNFFIITAYIPNSGQKLQRLDYRTKQYDIDFQVYLEQLRKKKPVILCGDLNVCHQQIDIAKPKGNQKTAGFTIEQRQNFTKFLNNGWIDTFRHYHPKQVKYSWWSMRTGGRQKNIGWRLDYFVVNKQFLEKIKQSYINNQIFGSDHCPIEIDVQL